MAGGYRSGDPWSDKCLKGSASLIRFVGEVITACGCKDGVVHWYSEDLADPLSVDLGPCYVGFLEGYDICFTACACLGGCFPLKVALFGR